MIDESVNPQRGTCSIDDCDEPGVVKPVVILVRPKPHGELEVPINLRFCRAHSEAVTHKTLLKSKWWDSISLQFRLRNQPQPIRNLTRLDWETLS